MKEDRKIKALAAAWGAWKSRHGEKLGPGPAFREAIDAAMAALEIDGAMSAIERWQAARIAACEVGIGQPEFLARWEELANAEHQLMRIKADD